MATSTIAAIASPPGPGARGIVRLSGPRAREIVRAAWAGPAPELARRGLAAGRLDDGRGTQPALLLWMPGPGSYTGEDVAELHLVGSPPLLGAALARVLALGAVPAEPGEFTRRAFLAGRIDLTRAEGVLELVRARTADEARAARSLLFGGLAERVDALRDALDDLRALCEASLDFDAADTGHVDPAEIEARAARVLLDVRAARAFEAARGRAGGTPRIALCGAPNAGKSALYNALLGQDAAIVSAFAGTTRDTLEAPLELDGLAARLSDVPGLDEAARGVDLEAQAHARERVLGADLRLWVVDAGDPAAVARAAQERGRLAGDGPVVLAWNKVDVPGAAGAPGAEELGCREVVRVSARTGQGVEELRRAILVALGSAERGGLEREVAERHERGLLGAEAELAEGLARWRAGAPLDLLAEHLRAATAGLDAITGRTTSEDLLDRIFARFCLGK